MRQAASSPLQLTVLDYFAGERGEMLTAIAFILAVAVSTAWLFVSSRTGFAMGLMVTVLLLGGAMGAGMASLMIRDRASVRVIDQTISAERSEVVVAGETARIGVVLTKYKYYRYASAVIAVVALAGLTLSDRGWVHGVASGLLLVVLAQVVIDHFSERRAQVYFARLNTSESPTLPLLNSYETRPSP